DLLGDAGLTGYLPPLPGVLQPVLAQEMIDSDADVLLGSFWSGTLYQPTAYNDLQASFQDLAPGMVTSCTQEMIDALDPRCVISTPGGYFVRRSGDVDHVLVRNGFAGCTRSDAPKLFAETSGISDHAGLLACEKGKKK